MVKRILLLLVPLVFVAMPAAAQDYAELEIGLGYANWAGLAVNSQGTALENHRIGGFVMQTNYNLNSWFGIDNYLGAYSYPDNAAGAGYTDWSAIYNVFGVKLTARDILDGAMSPYVVAGFGGGSISSNQLRAGRSSAAARYGGGIDFNLNDSFGFRLDASNLAIGNTLFSNSWSSDFNVAAEIVIKLAF
jgi:Outer membrane protein beta-barrel domain